MKTSGLNYLLADDHSIIRQGLSFLIKEIDSEATIFETNSQAEIAPICNKEKIDVLILDLNFPEGNSVTFLPDLRDKFPDLKILIFTAHDESIYATRCLTMGANGYLSKTASDDEMIDALKTIVETGKYLSESIKNKIMDSYISGAPKNPIQLLTNKEINIALLYVKGYGNMEISNHLSIKATTVSTYKLRIFEKLKIDSISSLIELFKLYYKEM